MPTLATALEIILAKIGWLPVIGPGATAVLFPGSQSHSLL